MSYSEKDGQVVLTMSREDYERVLMALGMATGAALRGYGPLAYRILVPLLNRVNEGNPDYTPYQEEALY
jgi:hypothetical protein